MARGIKEDIIGSLSESGGVITLGPSRITVGSRMFTIESASLSLPSLGTNTRHFIYAVNNGGALELVRSQNINSVGPAGYTAWKLVGAFYFNGLAAQSFGSFASIDGLPRTGPIPFDMVITGTGSNPARGGLPREERAFWWQEGRILHVVWDYAHSAGGTAGSGDFLYALPFCQARLTTEVETIKTPFVAIATGTPLGEATVRIPGSQQVCMPVIYNDDNPDQIGLYSFSGTDGYHGSFHHYGNANLQIHFHAQVPLVEFSDTPFKDL